MTDRRETIPASVAAVRRGDALDVSGLPSYGFSHRSVMWWGNAGMIAIEGVAFGFMIIIYFYLRSIAKTWPDDGAIPGLLWGTINLGLILLSAVPNHYTHKAALDRNIVKARWGLIALSVVVTGLVVVRWMEFATLKVRWDDGAYGSVLWVLLGIHSFNLVTDYFDTMVLAAVTYVKPMEGKRFVDIAENCGYWWFVVLSWFPIYAVVYWAERF